MARFVDILDGENSKAMPFIAASAILFHIVIIIIVPYILSLHWKPKILSRPPTFELVRLQMPQQEVRPAPPAPAPVPQTPPPPVEQPQIEPTSPPKPAVEKKIEPKKEEKPKEKPKEQPKPVETPKPAPVEEDISDLEDLFAEQPSQTVVSQSVSVQISEPFEYQWYLDQLQARIKNRWKPSANEKGEVVVRFSITRNGSMEGLKLVSSSGRSVLDRQALQAVEMSAPFAVLPSGFAGQTLSVVLTLKPQ